MKESTLLVLDGIGNILLGAFFIFSPANVMELLGIPIAGSSFYPNILGAILLGIGIALLLERFKDSVGMTGLGLGGAMSINLSFGFVLAIWLINSRINISSRGYILLWMLVIILIGISLFELSAYFIQKRNKAGI